MSFIKPNEMVDFEADCFCPSVPRRHGGTENMGDTATNEDS